MTRERRNELVEEFRYIAHSVLKTDITVYKDIVGFEYEDLLQEAYASLIKSVAAIDETRMDSARSFLWKCIYNDMKNYCKRNYNKAINYRHPSKTNELEDEIEDSSSNDLYSDSELSADIKHIIKKLDSIATAENSCQTDRIGALAILESLRGMSFNEFAKFSNRDSNDVRACVARVRAKIKKDPDFIKFRNSLFA